MLASKFIRPIERSQQGWFYRAGELFFERLTAAYIRSLIPFIRHRLLTLALFIATLATTAYLFFIVPKGFFPEQDTGFIGGLSQASPDISFAEMAKLEERVSAIIMKDPAVYSVFMDIGGGNGGNALNQGHVNITLKPLVERDASAKQVIDRPGTALNAQQGITLFMQSAQDINIGARPAKTQYQFTLQDGDIAELGEWASKITSRLQSPEESHDVGSDQQAKAPNLSIKIDRAAATLYGVLPSTIDDTLYDAFGQRQVASYSTQTDTFRVILEVLPSLQRDIATSRHWTGSQFEQATARRYRFPSSLNGRQMALHPSPSLTRISPHPSRSRSILLPMSLWERPQRQSKPPWPKCIRRPRYRRVLREAPKHSRIPSEPCRS